MHTFVMPTLGADMQAGTLVAWHKQPGDALRRGETIAEVDTEKGVIDVEVYVEGILDAILVQPGQRVPVGTALATIRERGAEAPVAGGAPAPEPPAAPPPRVAERQAASVPRVEERRARRLPPAGERMRRTIAAAMARSKREIPHYYLATTIDLQRASAWLAAENARLPVDRRLLPGVLFLKATALALREVPELNAVWEHDQVVVREKVHVGIAISLRQGGLVILALHDTATRSVGELMQGLRDLTVRARAGRMKSSELADSTITVTSLGDRGVESVYGVIYPPQVAIVGFGKVVERPWAAEGGECVRPVVTTTLAADHRVTDGHRGALFLAAVDRLLQEPEKL